LLTWNRPQRRNAWTPQLEQEYFAHLRGAAGDQAVRVIVVTGAQSDFCPGMDLELLTDSSNGSREYAPELRDPQTLPITIPKPIIAAIEGACVGTGFIQACVADVRFAASDAKIGAAFARRGIMAEHGLAVLLPALIGASRAHDILISGRVFTGQESAEMGLTRLSMPGHALEDALAYAQEIAEHCSPLALAVTKNQLYRELKGQLEEARLEALELWRSLREQPDFKEGVASFRAQRLPEFAPLTAATLLELDQMLAERNHDNH
jgi:enoyl-CoA hydratase/carnithine racemase